MVLHAHTGLARHATAIRGRRAVTAASFFAVIVRAAAQGAVNAKIGENNKLNVLLGHLASQGCGWTRRSAAPGCGTAGGLGCGSVRRNGLAPDGATIYGHHETPAGSTCRAL
jgi:hypothetical protein